MYLYYRHIHIKGNLKKLSKVVRVHHRRWRAIYLFFQYSLLSVISTHDKVDMSLFKTCC